MAIQAGLTAVRFYYNVCTSPENQLELVMEGVQVKLFLNFMFSAQYMIVFQACLNDNQAQARNGQAACNYKEVMDHLKVTLKLSLVAISRLHSLVTGRGCQARTPGTSPADGEPLERPEASRDGPACDPEGVGGLEKGHRSGDGSAATTTAAEQQQ